VNDEISSQNHPWKQYLKSRYDAILWLSSLGYDDVQISVTLYADPNQISAIKEATKSFGDVV